MILFLTLLVQVAANSYYKRHIPNCVAPNDGAPPSYSVKNWVEHLNLQQCVIVDIGEEYCAIFVEFRPHNTSKIIQEFFLGICDRETIFKWKLCSAEVERRRPNDCLFNENANIAARVHRRLCDLTALLQYGTHCNCTNSLTERPLFDVEGFPTCFQPPISTTICVTNNVCGIDKCRAKQLVERIYTIDCEQDCLGQQPFCETMEYETTIPREIVSFWSDWSEPLCMDVSCEILVTEAVCINKYTGLGDVDCLGPGTNCCPPDERYCKCRIISESGTLRILKIFESDPEYWLRTSEIPFDSANFDYVELKHKYKSHVYKHQLQYKRSARSDDDEYIEDDEDEDDTTEEDIAIEEDIEEQSVKVTVTTTELPEKDEIKEAVAQEQKYIHNHSAFDEYEESGTCVIKQFYYNICCIISIILNKI